MTLRIKNASVLSGVLLVALSSRSAPAQPYTVNGGEVNISGATLFKPFFAVPASTNDFIDADGDSCSTGACIDQLAPTFIPGLPLTTWWLVQDRGVGSVNGLNEFVDNQLCGTIPVSIPADSGYFNRFLYASGGVITWAGPYGDASGTPRSPSQIDLAVLDVPVKWATKAGTSVSATWNRKPTVAGYGLNPILSSTGYLSNLKGLDRPCSGTPLNTNESAPDAYTVYDWPVAWVPIVYLANRGSGVVHLKMTELQHLFVAGRLPNGENLMACTRSVGSGTRNGIMTTSGIDTSWGRGDNLGNEVTTTATFNLGPNFQPTNGEGSSQTEQATQNARLGVGYTGLAGSGRGADDALNSRYEIIDVMFDDRGGASYVRPTIDTVLDNCNANTGFQLGGPETFVSRGDAYDTVPAHPQYMVNQAAAAYLKNIINSVAAFAGVPGDPANFGMPGEYLATTFFLLAGVDCLPDPLNPTVMVANAGLNQGLQNYMRANNGLGIGGDTPVYGASSPAGLAPIRIVNPPLADTGNKYSDGKGVGDAGYCYSTSNVGNGSPATLPTGQKLGARNRLTGDFNNDGLRNLNDADKLVTAMFDPRHFEMGVNHAGGAGNQSINSVIPEVIGDFDGDGDFNQKDLRYFADGLAIDTGTGKLDRKQGAIAIDNAILAHGPATDYLGSPVADTHDWLPWRSTARTIVVPPSTPCDSPKYAVPSPSVNDVGSPFLKTGKTYAPGDFRGDVAGGTPVPGAKPVGFDGRVDAKDIDYVCHNFGDWSILNQAVVIDLSADMNGDLVVNSTDVDELVLNILGTNYGDVDLDGDVDAADEAIINAHLGQPGGWAEGNLNCDGIVDATDHAIWAANVTPVCSAPTVLTANSLKTHGTVGPVVGKIPVAINPASGANVPSECRSGGVTQVEVNFDVPVYAADGTLDGSEVTVTASLGTPSVSSVTGSGTSTIVINLTGVVNKSCVKLALSGIACDPAPGAPQIAATTLKIKSLFGDTNGNTSFSGIL